MTTRSNLPPMPSSMRRSTRPKSTLVSLYQFLLHPPPSPPPSPSPFPLLFIFTFLLLLTFHSPIPPPLSWSHRISVSFSTTSLIVVDRFGLIDRGHSLSRNEWRISMRALSTFCTTSTSSSCKAKSITSASLNRNEMKLSSQQLIGCFILE